MSLMQVYKSAGPALVYGRGATLWDERGNSYLDGVSGLGVCALGHSHPAIARVIADQAETLMHVSNAFLIPLQKRLAERLCGISGMDGAFLCNSGTEAVEAALKLSRLHARRRGLDRPTVVSVHRGFSGRSFGALSAAGRDDFRSPFEPVVPGFVQLPFNDLRAIERLAAEDANIVAVLLEPVQGEGGVRLASHDYLIGLEALCRKHDWLLMLDEIQSGMGRTGRWFACDHAGVKADVLMIAKALGNGFPIGACLARGEAARLFAPGHHGTTFGGNPLACRTALEVLRVIEEEGLIERAAELGAMIEEGLRARLDGNSSVCEIRRLGLMIGIELDRPAAQVRDLAVERGLLLNVTDESTVRLLPPYILSDAEAEQLVERTCLAIGDFIAAAPAEAGCG